MQGRRDLGCNLAEHCSFTRADIDCGSPKLKNHAAECLKQCQKWSIKMLRLFIALGKLCLKTEMLIEKRLSSSANKRLKSALNLVVWDLNTISCPIRSFQVFPNIHLYLNPRREFFFFLVQLNMLHLKYMYWRWKCNCRDFKVLYCWWNAREEMYCIQLFHVTSCASSVEQK